MWVLGIKPGSSVRATRSLNRSVNSPATHLQIFIKHSIIIYLNFHSRIFFLQFRLLKYIPILIVVCEVCLFHINNYIGKWSEDFEIHILGESKGLSSNWKANTASWMLTPLEHELLEGVGLSYSPCKMHLMVD